MTVTVFSFCMAFLVSSVFILLVHALRKKKAFLKGFGIPTILLLYGACIVRLALPVEFPFTAMVRIDSEYGGLFHDLTTSKIPLGGSETGLFGIIGWVWALGAILVLAAFLLSYGGSWIYLRRFENNRCPMAEDVLLQIQGDTGLRYKTRIFMYPGTSVPKSVGLFHRTILLPQQAYTEKELHYILLHEYTHFANHDQAVKTLVYLFLCVFWWNPLVYLLWKDLDQMLEIKCDMAVCKDFSDKKKAEYLRVLIQAIEKAKKQKRFGILPPMATPLFKRKKKSAMQERFHMLADPPSTQVVTTVQTAFFAGFLVLLLASYTFVLQPAYNPPAEDIYTSVKATEFTIEGGYILKNKNNEYFIIYNDESFPIKESTAKMLIELGYELKEDIINE